MSNSGWDSGQYKWNGTIITDYFLYDQFSQISYKMDCTYYSKHQNSDYVVSVIELPVSNFKYFTKHLLKVK